MKLAKLQEARWALLPTIKGKKAISVAWTKASVLERDKQLVKILEKNYSYWVCEEGCSVCEPFKKVLSVLKGG